MQRKLNKHQLRELNKFYDRQANKAKKANEAMLQISDDPITFFFCMRQLQIRNWKHVGIVALLILSQGRSAKAKPANPSCQRDFNCASQNVKIEIAPGVEPAHCDYIKQTLVNIQTAQPDSTAVIKNTLAGNTRFVCMNESVLNVRGTGSTHAMYNVQDDFISFKAHANEHLAMRYTIHEILHRTDSHAHQTVVCNSKKFAGVPLVHLHPDLVEFANPDYKDFLSATPVYPPTPGRQAIFKNIIIEELLGHKIQELRKLHIMYYTHKEMTKDEQKRYGFYCDLLADTLMYDDRVIAAPQGHAPNQIPTKFVTEFGVVYHDLIMAKRININYLQGYIIDPVSTFLHGVMRALMEYHSFIELNINELYLSTVANGELHTNAITGLSNKAKEYFFPKTEAMIAEDRKCCVEGDMNACEQILRKLT